MRNVRGRGGASIRNGEISLVFEDLSKAYFRTEVKP